MFSPFEEQDPPSLFQRLEPYVINVVVVTHTFFSYLILFAGLVWSMLLLEEIIAKGRLPIESDARFLTGIRFQIGFISLIFVGFGSIFWAAFTATFIWVKAFRARLHALKLGLIGLVLNILLFYLLFFSEAGQWILD